MITTNLEEWTADTLKHVQQSVTEALEATAKDAVAIVRKHTDANRTETRKATRHRMLNPGTAAVGLFFSKQYSNAATSYTAKLFRTIWEDKVTPKIRERLITRLNERLQK